MTSPRRVVIDTDPGLDDAVAILFALASSRFDIRGVTTVAGNIGLATTTRNAGRLLALLDREAIPVVSGAASPLARRGIDEVRIHGDDGLGGVDLPEPRVPALAGAADWLAGQLTAAPAGSIDVLALGPLTNIALLLRTHPDAARRIGRLVVMGGAVNEKGNVGARSEFNFASDPEALDIVLRAGLALTIIPLDVTRRVRATPDYVAALRQGGTASRAAADLVAAYFLGGRESRPLHDPCVMLYAVAPELFGVDRMAVSVDLTTDPGALLVDGPMAVPVDIAMRVDPDAALQLLRAGLA
ncbi:nucleoside hydrolase [Devosia albogilva]|uniref:Nucleoside hydrolase n=1 Tax=Devosia albogilva TaxID=429726 RepID=A0ABW5QG86_9HYPH